MSEEKEFEILLLVPVTVSLTVKAEDEDEALEKAYKAAKLSSYADGTIGSPCSRLGVALYPAHDAIELIKIKEKDSNNNK